MLRQFLKGSAAQAYQRSITIGAQLIVLPIMLHGWGAAAYGGWLALDSLRSILSMSDLGLAQIAANRMTEEVASGNRAEAIRTNATCWAMMLSAAGIITLLGLIVGVFVPLGPLLNVDRPAAELGITFFLLSLVAAGTVVFGAISAALRAEGLFWLMSLCSANFQLASAIAMAACALLETGYIALAIGLAILQVLTFGPVAIWLLWRHPWTRPSIIAFEGTRLRHMLAPSLSYMLYTFTNMVTIQGVNILVAVQLGPVAVTSVSAVRTLTRLGRTAASIIIHPIEPIFAQLRGQSNPEQASAIYKRLVQGGGALAISFGVLMALLGPQFLDWWTAGNVVGHDQLHYLMTVAITFEILWFTLQTPYVATNRHSIFAGWVTLAGVTSTAACWMLLPIIGLDAAGWSLLFMNIVILIQTAARSRLDPPIHD